MECMWEILVTTKMKEHIVFRYLLTDIQLYTLILLELNIFHKNYWSYYKSVTHNIFRIQDNEFIICWCYGIVRIYVSYNICFQGKLY